MRVLKRCAYPTCVNIESHHYKFLACEGCVNNSKLAQAARYCSHKCQGNLVNIVRLNIENYKCFPYILDMATPFSLQSGIGATSIKNFISCFQSIIQSKNVMTMNRRLQ